jgi:hypothetical protein
MLGALRACDLQVLDEIRTNFRVGSAVTGGHWAELSATTSGDFIDSAVDMAPDM